MSQIQQVGRCFYHMCRFILFQISYQCTLGVQIQQFVTLQSINQCFSRSNNLTSNTSSLANLQNASSEKTNVLSNSVKILESSRQQIYSAKLCKQTKILRNVLYSSSLLQPAHKQVLLCCNLSVHLSVAVTFCCVSLQWQITCVSWNTT